MQAYRSIMNAHAKARRQKLSLDSVDPCSPELLQVSSPRSLEAVQKRGLTLKDLAYVPRADFHKQGQSPEVTEAVYRRHEDTRLRRLQEVTEERLRLVASHPPTSRSLSNVPRTNFEAALDSMRVKERNRLHKLELKKTKELIQIAVGGSPDLRSGEKNIGSRSAQPTPPQVRTTPKPPRLSKKATDVPSSDHKPASTTHKRGTSLSPTSVYETANTTLGDMRRKLEARARLIAESKAKKGSEAQRRSESPETALHTKSSNTQSQGCSEVDLETREKRRKEQMAAIEAQRHSRRKEKERTWQARVKRLHQLESEEEHRANSERQRLAAVQLQALQRFHQAQLAKESQITDIASKESEKNAQSRLRRERLQQLDSLRASQDYEEYTVAERKSEELRLSRIQSIQQHGEINDHHRGMRYAEAQRLKRMEEYHRMKILEKINEENEFSKRLQSAKAQELQLKQRLRKQLENEKRVMAERFERLTLVKGPQLLHTLRASRPISMSPSLLPKHRRRKSSVTPSPAPPPRIMDYSTSAERLSDPTLPQSDTPHPVAMSLDRTIESLQ